MKASPPDLGAHLSRAALLSAGLSLGFEYVLQVGDICFCISLIHADHNRLRQPEEATRLRFEGERELCAALNGLEGHGLLGRQWAASDLVFHLPVRLVLCHLGAPLYSLA